MFIALVDDDESVRVAISSLLRAYGHEVFAFSSAEEFVSAQIRPSCLVLDSKPPAMSGLDLHRYLENNHQLMPVAFVTSSNNCAAEVEALVARGAVLAQFGKPFDAPDFLAAIERARVQ